MPNKDTFNASDYGRLRYDFKAFGGKTGPIEDPSDDMIESFLDAMRVIAKKYMDEDSDKIDKMTSDELAEYLDNDDRIKMIETQREMAAAVADLCRQSPTGDEIMALPFRVRQGFMRWVQRKVTDPEF